MVLRWAMGPDSIKSRSSRDRLLMTGSYLSRLPSPTRTPGGTLRLGLDQLPVRSHAVRGAFVSSLELGEHFVRDGVRGRNLKTRELNRPSVDIRRLPPSLNDEAEKCAQGCLAAEFERVEGKRVPVSGRVLARPVRRLERQWIPDVLDDPVIWRQAQ